MNNTDSSTDGFFGDPDMIKSVLKSIAAYLQISLMIILPLMVVLGTPLIFIWENRKERLFRNPVFWSALIGYGVGVSLNLAILGNVKKNDIVYKSPNGLELGDPDVASSFPPVAAFVISFTTLTSVGAAKSLIFAHRKCRDKFATSRAIDNMEVETQRLTHQI